MYNQTSSHDLTDTLVTYWESFRDFFSFLNMRLILTFSEDEWEKRPVGSLNVYKHEQKLRSGLF